MKYLLFNVVVGAALLYLFAGPSNLPSLPSKPTAQLPHDLDRVADRMIKNLDQRLQENLIQRPQTQPAVEKRQPKSVPTPPNLEREASQLAEPSAPLAVSPQVTPVSPPLPEQPAPPLFKAAPAARAIATKPQVDPPSQTEPPARVAVALEPAVMQRRAEVLAGTGVVIPPEMIVEHHTTPNKVAVKLAEGESLMSPHNRRRELRALANDMESLYIDILTQ
ncbi:hypothetical protein Mmc1_0179 [Magnetococcus marinus MC-1]|uniref:Uncharacterized protein n=1 Tax=Magnetococcus marinus (strain ATCC BAA-1437 / JCM 17883 / MC-1) TaxID=156889 RepID=A0L413_MAGMM|nr:hypothetical protein [Magnetococcus marinus]ABK42706.1 hypothetical protein Mmc1_0179 [Magnetococcus marinus MC-1]